MTTEVKNKRSSKAIYTGIVIIGLGVLWLLSKMGIIYPGWLLSWEMILIVIGAGIGIDNGFRKPASWVLIAIGAFFLIEDLNFIPWDLREYFWPILVIAIGLVIALRPKSSKRWKNVQQRYSQGGDGGDDDNYDPDSKGTLGYDSKIDTVSIFNGLKRTVLSKHFRGGESVTVFGGTEINLLQADFDKLAHLDVSVVFGGLKLIVPQNWEVRSEITSVLAGVEDKRFSAVEVVPDEKVLVLTGAVIFGGVDIVSY